MSVLLSNVLLLIILFNSLLFLIRITGNCDMPNCRSNCQCSGGKALLLKLFSPYYTLCVCSHSHIMFMQYVCVDSNLLFLLELLIISDFTSQEIAVCRCAKETANVLEVRLFYLICYLHGNYACPSCVTLTLPLNSLCLLISHHR